MGLISKLREMKKMGSGSGRKKSGDSSRPCRSCCRRSKRCSEKARRTRGSRRRSTRRKWWANCGCWAVVLVVVVVLGNRS